MKKPSIIILWFAIIFSITIVGVTGFMLIENYRFLDALYMTVITITTIGYSETKRLSDSGRVFNLFLIFFSFSTITYAFAKLTQYISSGDLQLYLKDKKMIQALSKLNNHVIICGFGRNGQQAAKTLTAHNVPFIVLDIADDQINNYLLQDPKLLYLKGDATDDDVLFAAGIERAKSLICALPTDADNVFIVLTARALHNSIQIISRASTASAVTKLKIAGADNIIMPDKIGGTHMATLVSKPDVIEFIDYLSSEEGQSINIESVSYEKLPKILRNATLKTIMDWKATGVVCLGIKDSEGKFIIHPNDETLISKDMKIIVLGNKEQIADMKKLV